MSWTIFCSCLKNNTIDSYTYICPVEPPPLTLHNCFLYYQTVGNCWEFARWFLTKTIKERIEKLQNDKRLQFNNWQKVTHSGQFNFFIIWSCAPPLVSNSYSHVPWGRTRNHRSWNKQRKKENKQTNKTEDLTESFLWREQIFSPTYPYSYLTSEFTLFSRLKELRRGDPAVFRNANDQRVWPQHCHKGEGIICSRSHFSFSLCSFHTDSSTKCSTEPTCITFPLPTLHARWRWQCVNWDHWKRFYTMVASTFEFCDYFTKNCQWNLLSN